MTFITKTNGKGEDYQTNDDIYTPEPIAKMLIGKINHYIQPNHTLYDPFRGGGAFYNNFPCKTIKEWSEIKENEDFFDWRYPVDWIISNPPYSKYTEVMQHSYEIAENICYLVPLSKVVSSMQRIRELNRWGGIIKMWILPSSMCGFPFGFPACFFWARKGYKGSIEVEVLK